MCVGVGANVNTAGNVAHHPHPLLRRPLSKRLPAHSDCKLNALFSRLMIFRRHNKYYMYNICFDDQPQRVRVGSAYIVGVFDFFSSAAVNEMSKNDKSLRLLFIQANKMRV